LAPGERRILCGKLLSTKLKSGADVVSGDEAAVELTELEAATVVVLRADGVEVELVDEEVLGAAVLVTTAPCPAFG